MKKKIFGLSFFFVAIILGIAAYILKYEKDSKEITIIYTTDVHTKLDNVTEGGLTYGNVKALREDLEESGQVVFLVDEGDNIQGSVYGSFDQGESVVELMELANYDASAVGNHEFDYGMFRALQVMEESEVSYISCNFRNAVSDERMISAYKIIERNGIKVGFIGITTPETLLKASPILFQDEDGNVVYDFSDGENGELLYAVVQGAIDEIRDQVDYVVLLSHLGNDYYSAPYRSCDVINHTTGVDLVLDGHSHKVIKKQVYNDAEGKPVALSQAGSYFDCIGVAKLSKHELSVEIIKEYDKTDAEMEQLAKKDVERVEASLGKKLAVLDNPLYINDANDSSKRLIRLQDTNISDFVTDGVYWYFNEKLQMPCDITVSNGGGLRADVPAGEFSALASKSIQPFGNKLCMVELTGQEVLDMLEWGARNIGKAQAPALLHTAGLTYKIDKDLESTVLCDMDQYEGAPTGEYKVSDVKIYNRVTGIYDPLDLDRKYTVAGVNFVLRNAGDGFTMLKDAEPVVDYIGEDYEIVAQFAAAFAGGNDGFPHINNKNSPMAKYENYIYDYENPLGSGRIAIE